jgi:hypothetical protein
VRNVELLPVPAVFKILHPELAKSLSLRPWLYKVSALYVTNHAGKTYEEDTVRTHEAGLWIRSVVKASKICQ